MVYSLEKADLQLEMKGGPSGRQIQHRGGEDCVAQHRGGVQKAPSFLGA